MKVKELIKQLEQVDKNNEVRLIAGAYGNDYTGNIHVSFDDVGDVLIYEIVGDKLE